MGGIRIVRVLRKNPSPILVKQPTPRNRQKEPKVALCPKHGSIGQSEGSLIAYKHKWRGSLDRSGHPSKDEESEHKRDSEFVYLCARCFDEDGKTVIVRLKK